MLPAKITYISAVDGLRAMAVFLVLFHHWISNTHFWGEIGVDIFFVISGFLITQILLSYKEKIEGGGSVTYYLKIFYLRRFYRIFPIYYLFILGSFLLV